MPRTVRLEITIDEDMAGLDHVTAVIVNYKTLDLTRRAVETFRGCYPDLSLLLIDNGSADASTEYLQGLAERHENICTVVNERNRYHGPALDQAMSLAGTPYVFTLDSDCEVVGGGFLGEMLALFADDAVYAVGEVRYKNRFGFTYGYDEAQAGRPRRIPYVHPYAMLIDRGKYGRLHPFIHHGAPCIKNMRDAQRRGLTVHNFQIDRFVVHHTEGTSASHGYGGRARSRQLVEHLLTRAEGFVLRDPVVKVRTRVDRDER
jgi:glycosyltransferase involved in cell wall biosynthesis